MNTPRPAPDRSAAPGPVGEAAVGEAAALVSCAGVAHTYGSGRTAVVAVHDVSCRVLPTTRVAITGPSGSGKSTLLHLMAGLETVTAGVLSWPGLNGHPLAHPGRVGIVFQGPSMLPALDALENVEFPLLLAGIPDHRARELARGAMHRLGITDLAGQLPQELSAGQAQRVAVARALAGGPVLILADEPTGQLDHHAAAHVVDALLQAADEFGAALLIFTHDPVIAARLPQRWTMADGRLLGPALNPMATAEPARTGGRP